MAEEEEEQQDTNQGARAPDNPPWPQFLQRNSCASEKDILAAASDATASVCGGGGCQRGLSSYLSSQEAATGLLSDSTSLPSSFGSRSCGRDSGKTSSDSGCISSDSNEDSAKSSHRRSRRIAFQAKVYNLPPYVTERNIMADLEATQTTGSVQYCSVVQDFGKSLNQALLGFADRTALQEFKNSWSNSYRFGLEPPLPPLLVDTEGLDDDDAGPICAVRLQMPLMQGSAKDCTREDLSLSTAAFIRSTSKPQASQSHSTPCGPDQLLDLDAFAGPATSDGSAVSSEAKRALFADVPREKMASPAGIMAQGVTSLMLRSLPADLTQAALLQKLDSAGYAGQYDFCYLPWILTARANHGYAFVNFKMPTAAARLVEEWSGRPIFDASKPIFAAPAMQQGLKHMLKLCEKKKLSRIRNPRYRPFIEFTEDVPDEELPLEMG